MEKKGLKVLIRKQKIHSYLDPTNFSAKKAPKRTII